MLEGQRDRGASPCGLTVSMCCQTSPKVRESGKGWIPVGWMCPWQHREGLRPRVTAPSSGCLSLCFVLQLHVLQPQPLRGNIRMENKQRLCPLAGSSWRAQPSPRDVQVERLSLAHRSPVPCCLVHVGFDSISQFGCQARGCLYTLSPSPNCRFPPPNCGFPSQSLSAVVRQPL